MLNTIRKSSLTALIALFTGLITTLVGCAPADAGGEHDEEDLQGRAVALHEAMRTHGVDDLSWMTAEERALAGDMANLFYSLPSVREQQYVLDFESRVARLGLTVEEALLATPEEIEAMEFVDDPEFQAIVETVRRVFDDPTTLYHTGETAGRVEALAIGIALLIGAGLVIGGLLWAQDEENDTAQMYLDTCLSSARATCAERMCVATNVRVFNSSQERGRAGFVLLQLTAERSCEFDCTACERR